MNTHCPLCYTPLEVRDVVPCWVCGHRPEEIDHALSGRHRYAEMRILGDLSAVWCDFCQVDFGSFAPQFFGLAKGSKIGFEHMYFVRSVDVHIGKDKYCPQCGYRLAFLNFVDEARRQHKQS